MLVKVDKKLFQRSYIFITYYVPFIEVDRKTRNFININYIEVKHIVCVREINDIYP